MWRLFCTALVLGLVIHSTDAQFNLKVGYRLGILDAPVHDAIIQQHNLLNDSYSTIFRPLKSLHGFELGVRQRNRNVSYEFGWKLQRNMQKATGNFIDGTPYENQLTYEFQAISTGLYGHLGPVSIGGSLDYNFLRIKQNFVEPDQDDSMKDNLFSSDFSLTYTFPSDGVVTLALQPYFRVNWGQYDITPLYESLTNSVAEGPRPMREKFAMYGFSVIVYNGYQ
ncbi:MAG: hypothetical protein R3301_06815 [Saprospiraceae bacterium]|nr:hypothetical protein [Saprospiraceae bacterium]